MKTLTTNVVSLNLGSSDELRKHAVDSLVATLAGFEGDRHGGFERENWHHDKQAKGVVRRNERQWTAISTDELAQISRDMDLTQTLTTADVGVNIGLSGIANLSHLPKGSILKFPSGAELIVEEYNPPCKEMGEKLAAKFQTNSGGKLVFSDFPKAAKTSRGILGVIDVAGIINVGDEVEVSIYQNPAWLENIS